MSVLSEPSEKAVEDLTPKAVTKGSTAVSLAIHDAILAGGYPTRKLADFFHGTWLGHPLHPVLTDMTIGAWAMGSMFDVAGALTNSKELCKTGDHLALAGTLSAVPTAVSGIVDYSTFPEPSAAPVTWHAVLNVINLGVFVESVRQRRKGNHARGALLSGVGLALTCASAWLGGALVYKYRVGVDHSDEFDRKKSHWTAVLDLKNLPPHKAKRVEFEGKSVMLYRDSRGISAIGAICSHAGGPLDEGKVARGCVTCPWHDSVFKANDGKIVHGPATQPQPAFETRVREGKIEIRLKK